MNWAENERKTMSFLTFTPFFFLRRLVSLLYSLCIWAGLKQNICSLIQENVRKYLVYPCSILVWDSFTRILYGKMHSKTGKDSAGKSNSQFRRSIVFRFLNGCSGDEIIKFMEMVFENFKHFVTGKCNKGLYVWYVYNLCAHLYVCYVIFSIHEKTILHFFRVESIFTKMSFKEFDEFSKDFTT